MRVPAAPRSQTYPRPAFVAARPCPLPSAVGTVRPHVPDLMSRRLPAALNQMVALKCERRVTASIWPERARLLHPARLAHRRALDMTR